MDAGKLLTCEEESRPEQTDSCNTSPVENLRVYDYFLCVYVWRKGNVCIYECGLGVSSVGE